MKVESTESVQPVGARKDGRGERRASREANENEETGQASDDIVLFGIPQDELTPNVRRAVNRLAEQLEETRGELDWAKRRMSELEELADHDALTGTLNRRAFLRELDRSMAFAARYSLPLSIVFLDINGLKAINDRYGHAAGDDALRQVGETLIQRTRRSDSVARIGGDEFALILPQTSHEAAEELAGRLGEAVAALTVAVDGDTVALSIACGVHTVDPQEDAESAMAVADQDMYARKRGEPAGRAVRVED